MKLKLDKIMEAIRAKEFAPGARISQIALAEAVGTTNITLRNWAKEMPKQAELLYRLGEISGLDLEDMVDI